MTTRFIRRDPVNDVAYAAGVADEFVRDHLVKGQYATGGFKLDKVTVTHRLTTQLGRTMWFPSGRVVVLLNWAHLAFGSWGDIVDTIAHETAHVMAGHEADHGPAWVTWARQLGATPEATTETDVPKKYEVRHCGETFRWSRHRADSWYSCPRCGARVDTVTKNW